MGSRVKEDEKNEKIIRNLLKLQENRRCINCNSLGPQYVCTNFSTFICTTCSGVHREFTHRVKSVSMAKFTPQEVSALQGGGNASAREIYLKEWDPQLNSLPDGSNIDRLRGFIKHVYVDRRYTGEGSFEKPPRAKGETEDYNENRRIDTYQGGSRSPLYEDTYERRYNDRPSTGGRSPGYDRDSRQHGDYKKSPARVDVVNDWRREDRFGNGRKSEDRSSDGGSRLDSRSPDHQRDLETPSPPVVLPIRELLGENVSPLRVAEPHTAGGRSADDSVHTRGIASSSSLASSNVNPAEVKMVTSLIDFDSAPAPEPPVTAAVPQTQQVVTATSAMQPTSSGDNWANFDSVPDVKVAQAASNSNSVLDVLSELSIPASAPGPSAGSHGNDMFNSLSGNVPAFPSGSSQTSSFGSAYGGTAYPAAAISNSAMVSPAGAPSASPGTAPILPTGKGNSFDNAFTGGTWPAIQPQQPPVFPGIAGLPNSQPVTVGGPSSNQPWNSLVGSNAHRPPGVELQTSQTVTMPAMQTSIGVATQSYSEVKASGRTELPADLFTANYSSFTPPVPGWHSRPFQGTGFPMQYMPMSTATFQQVSRPSNPFDVRNDISVQAAMFPSMVSLQAALPNIAPSSNLGTFQHVSSLPTQSPSYASAISPSSYQGQQVPGNMTMRPQGLAGFGLEAPAFVSTNPNLHLTGLHPAPASPNNFSSARGNPFG
ncbi:probable ADP-ribosylation factor GTPase-activating protein AGD14 isoform X2 [Olea europaea var. sylvestris]|uniref:probable ADP-ribosylation factor GTPase-activating protein AGD14 isoform X2 n=1 Tax=Olea europaea var. sylvestris TaxID=158386 RepID=UPI000C1CDA7B|nr:probable ADP-ribosylation factor GTPase-activating protein AGD14 isoform X2 [Olea europaea var. sylvestris]